MKRFILILVMGISIFSACTDEKINTITNTVVDTLVDTQYIFDTDSIYDTIIINDTINDTVYAVHFLNGDYTGTYTVIADISIGGDTLVEQEIEWEFYNGYYSMYDSTHSICTPSGMCGMVGYQFFLSQIDNGTSGAVCNEDLNPQGYFGLRTPDDSVILAQQINDTLRWIQLVRK
ncbi:MAG: hypothetical protein DWP97_10980 [Calditrichaeota bacterium]|nr:MAG: hypothetical protein DWP97_10980 [Calditrichota bacterium]